MWGAEVFVRPFVRPSVRVQRLRRNQSFEINGPFELVMVDEKWEKKWPMENGCVLHTISLIVRVAHNFEQKRTAEHLAAFGGQVWASVPRVRTPSGVLIFLCVQM